MAVARTSIWHATKNRREISRIHEWFTLSIMFLHYTISWPQISISCKQTSILCARWIYIFFFFHVMSGALYLLILLLLCWILWRWQRWTDERLINQKWRCNVWRHIKTWIILLLILFYFHHSPLFPLQAHQRAPNFSLAYFMLLFTLCWVVIARCVRTFRISKENGLNWL